MDITKFVVGVLSIALGLLLAGQLAPAAVLPRFCESEILSQVALAC
jgi:hypothetical protein